MKLVEDVIDCARYERDSAGDELGPWAVGKSARSVRRQVGETGVPKRPPQLVRVKPDSGGMTPRSNSWKHCERRQ